MVRFIHMTAAGVLGRWFLFAVAMFVLERNLAAEPMVYTGLVVTDVRVGTVMMHNASLTITFEGDTVNITPAQVATTTCPGTTPFNYLAKGIARIEIKFQGSTHTARLEDGQIFVAVDQCNGGIGFGSFLGPNGLEPAYPLAFTMGTAEYAAINDPSPLTTILSTTGSAWSCIGYPPLAIGNLPGTSTGNCTRPDSYPLKSDIGDIFVYQPYFEYCCLAAPTEITSNHSGSTNRGAFLVRRPAARATRATLGDSENEGEGVVYTLQTVTDGSLGGHVFNQALVTLQMISDTHSVNSQPSSVDPTKRLYENRAGYATITVDDGREVLTAEFEPGEVYVRYDSGIQVAGFGSKISPTYPVALNCSNSAYPSEGSYTLDCLQGEAWNYLISQDQGFTYRDGILGQLSDPNDPSAGVLALPQSLSQNTLLTGTTHACAGVYMIGPNNVNSYIPGDLGVCAGPAPLALRTSKGELFLQDQEGGSLFLNNPPGGEAGGDPGWDLGNSGFFHVELRKGRH